MLLIYNSLFVFFVKPQVILQDRVAESYCSRPVVFSQRCAQNDRQGFFSTSPLSASPTCRDSDGQCYPNLSHMKIAW